MNVSTFRRPLAIDTCSASYEPTAAAASAPGAIGGPSAHPRQPIGPARRPPLQNVNAQAARTQSGPIHCTDGCSNVARQLLMRCSLGSDSVCKACMWHGSRLAAAGTAAVPRTGALSSCEPTVCQWADSSGHWTKCISIVNCQPGSTSEYSEHSICRPAEVVSEHHGSLPGNRAAFSGVTLVLPQFQRMWHVATSAGRLPTSRARTSMTHVRRHHYALSAPAIMCLGRWRDDDMVTSTPTGVYAILCCNRPHWRRWYR